MQEVQHLPLFIASGLALNLTPGPDVMFIVTQSLRGGFRSGSAAALGISAGCLVHVAAAALGVSALVAASATAFGLLKWVGAAYLAWMGWRMLFAPKNIAGDGSVLANASQIDGQSERSFSVFRRGLLTNALNPKVALFFLAFVPQFIVPGASSPALAFGLLGMVFIGGGLGVCLGYAWLAALAAARFSAVQQAMGWVERTAGALFIALGIRLAFSDNPST